MKESWDKLTMIYTIGHSNNKIEKLIELLKIYKINLVLDVRSYPYSKYNPQFNGKALSKTLLNHEIAYEFLGGCLGGRPNDPTCYKTGTLPEGRVNYLELVDYEMVAKKDWYLKGILKLLDLSADKRAAIMCSEEDPSRCHRHHLIAKTLLKNQVQIGHIRRDGTLQEILPDNRQAATNDILIRDNAKNYTNKNLPFQQRRLFELGGSDTIPIVRSDDLDDFRNDKSNSNQIVLYTIGFTQKSAKKFFSLLEENGVQQLIDVRLNPKGQLAGFTKKDDLSYFLNKILNCEYYHLEILAPSKEILSEYREDKNWNKYTSSFESLMDERGIPESLNDNFLKNKVCCLLCSEEKPAKCHRRLIAERMARHWPNIEIIHLQ